MNLYYLHFNNYYNRIVKKFDTLAEYLTLPYYDNVATNDIAFNPNDGVDTKQVANIPVGNEFSYDYAVLADGNIIVSRWFIIDANRNRNGQYTLTLRRDMFADSLEGVLDAPAFIEKATLEDNDPLIFNSEDMTFNQIKKAETLLKDKTSSPWIVGYIATDSTIQEQNIVYQDPVAYGNLEDFESLYNSSKSTITSDSDVFIFGAFDCKIRVKDSTNYYDFVVPYKATPDSLTTPYKSVISSPNPSLSTTSTNNALSSYAGYIYNNYELFKNSISTYYNLTSYNTGASILDYNGKILYDDTTQKYYKITVNTNVIEKMVLPVPLNNAMFNNFESATTNNQYITGSGVFGSYQIVLNNVVGITYTKEEVSGETIKYKISSGKIKLEDAPYQMFAMPYGATTFKYLEDGVYKTVTLNEDKGRYYSIAVANSIIEQLGGTSATALYDIQLLPYCPLQDNIDAEGSVVLDTADYYEKIVNSNGEVISFILFAKKSRNEFNIECNISITNTKIESQCDMYRLCSPNWNGQFEFNAAKNGGVTTINVDFEYKPFQPYIHLNPNFGRLYGQDYNDARGLICNGDFSLTQISDAWATYQRQNVNYEKQFNRQIQNMEVSNRLQNIQADIQGAVGVAGGVLGGSMAGGIVGGVIGGIVSAGAAAGDAVIRRQAQAEAIDYTKDQFGYSLGNIKALPDSLTKVTAFNNNNKLFPVLEYYSCTNEEKLALENKIKYNGMTVMRIGTIREFQKNEPTYIKGKLIRIEGILEDYHYVNELANEFNKGVFI